MGLAGGAADKAGNRYENWWTALKVADLLRGEASRIRLEPVGQAGEGIEFQLVAKGEAWCDQVKDVPSRGPGRCDPRQPSSRPSQATLQPAGKCDSFSRPDRPRCATLPTVREPP
ncbi:hypothetical protein [Streptomyces hydrogenans]